MATKKQQQSQGRTLTINGKAYAQPKASVPAYMHYLEVRDSVMETEGKRGLYTAKQFSEIIDCIVEMYGNQFTAADVTDGETGLSVDQIILAFAAIEVGIGESVNDNMREMQENFMQGK